MQCDIRDDAVNRRFIDGGFIAGRSQVPCVGYCAVGLPLVARCTYAYTLPSPVNGATL